MISPDASSAIVADLHGLASRHSEAISEWEAVAFMLAFAMRQMADLDEHGRENVGVYAAMIAASMHERRLN